MINDFEFVYLLERLVIPVLKSLKSWKIRISSSEFNLLGENLNLTHDCLSYTLYQFKTQLTQKVDFNYNEYNYSEEAKNCFRWIIENGFFPNDFSVKKLSVKDLKTAGISMRFYNFVVKMIEEYCEVYPLLKTDINLLNFEKKVVSKFPKNAALGGHCEDFLFTKEYVEKKVSKREFSAYQLIAKKSDGIKLLFPKLIDSRFENGVHFLKLENLTEGNNYNLMDIKISLYIKDRYLTLDTFRDFKFHIAGLQIMEKEEKVNIYRKTNALISKSELFKVLMIFFKGLSETEIGELFEEFESFLKQVLNFSKNENFGFNESSVILLFAPETKKWRFSMIDLAYHEDFFDENLRENLEGIISFFKEFEKERKSY